MSIDCKTDYEKITLIKQNVKLKRKLRELKIERGKSEMYIFELEMLLKKHNISIK